MSDVIKAIDECIESAEKVRILINNNNLNALSITDLRRCINRMIPLISGIKIDFVSSIENNEKNLLNNVGMLNTYSFGAIICILPLCKQYFSTLSLIDRPKKVGGEHGCAKIFISHSTSDINYIKPFVHMLEKVGIKGEHLFCSSVQGYGIPLNEDIYTYIQQQFQNNDLYIIYMLSKNYYNSPACLNEMGAAWVLKSDYQSILIPPFDFENIKGAIDPTKISFRIDDSTDCKYRLTELKDKIFDKLNLMQKPHSHWERIRDEFLDEISRTNKSM